MQVIINGIVKEIKPSLNITRLLEDAGIELGAVVVQYNGDIVDKARWGEVMLKENDELEILRFVGGG